MGKEKAGGAAVAPPEGGETREVVPVVAVGASSGGDNAMAGLLRAFPRNPGVAIVYVQQGRPAASHLERFRKATSMEIVEALAGDLPLKPNTVYIGAPGRELLVDREMLRSRRAADAAKRRMPVDALFRSVASDRGAGSMAVVLSGAASDGSFGLGAVKEAGGITFAQDPRTAEHDAMPLSAIASGCVDFVLAPQEIAREIAGIARHPYVASATPAAEDEDEAASPQRDLHPIFGVLRERTGVDFSLYKHGTIRRRVARRMAMRQIHGYRTYLRYLADKPAEVDALYRDLLINVTGFFRDPDVFEALKTHVFPTVLKTRFPDQPIRIWVPGCSTGEEVYSLAICLMEFLKDAALTTPIQIFGTDVSETVIERARAGVYAKANVAQDVSEQRIRRFFTSVESGYQISAAIRDMCVFARQNITRDPPFSKIDLVSCRNVLIYLGPLLHRRILSMFHYALKPSGFLVLGNSESIGSYGSLFAPIDKKQRVFARRPGTTRIGLELPSEESRAAMPATHRRSEAGATGAEIQREADRLVLNRFAPPGVLVNAEGTILQFRGQTGRYLEPAPGEASLNVLKMAREGLLVDLRTALHDAVKRNVALRREGLRVKSAEDYRTVNLQVLPVPGSPVDPCYLVLFEEATAPKPPAKKAAPPIVGKKRNNIEADLERLREELASTKLYLQSIIEEQEATNEELKSANEEIQSSNEELQSTNEELETAKEELQSTNEELHTLNDELQNRNAELSQLNNDVNNLLSSVCIPVVMLDGDLRVRRFTPMAGEILNLIPADVGRPILDIKPNIEVEDLERMLNNALDTLTVHESQVRDRQGRWHSLTARPYKTSENKIEGLVLTVMDIDALKRGTEREQAAREFAEAIVDTVRDCLLVLDPELRVQSANRSFYESFGLTKAEVEGRSIEDVDHGQWRIPGLRAFLEEARDKSARLLDFEVEHGFNRLGNRTLLFNSRRIEENGDSAMLLLAVRDITEQKKSNELRYRRLFESARDAIVVVDAETGRITDVNPYTLEWLKFARNELLGRQLWTTGIFSDREGAEFIFRQVLDKGPVRLDGMHLESSDHESVEAELIGNAYLEGTRKVVQLNMRDVTERKKIEDQVRASLRDKEVLVQEIHHRVKNNLQVISSILSLQAKYIRDGELMLALNETRNRVRAIAAIHEMLYQTKGFARIEIGPYLRKLAAMLLDFYGVEDGAVGMDIDIGAVWLDIDKAIPCGLIVNELISNSLKHAFKDKGKGRICISLEPEELNCYRLMVGDNGIGFQKNFDIRKTQSLGLQMVHLLADQLGGTVALGGSKGAEVTIRFPGGGPAA